MSMSIQKSILISSSWNVFNIFAEDPLKIHYVKEIARKINLAPTSVKLHCDKLEKENLIMKIKGERFVGFMANRENEDFVFYKRIMNKITLKQSNLLTYLIKTLYPQTIILYGSFMRGEDVKESDIDILIISKSSAPLNLDKFEKILNKKIDIKIIKNISDMHKNLQLEINNGEVLYGYRQ